MANVPQFRIMPVPGTRSVELAWIKTDGTVDTTQPGMVIDLADANGRQVSLQKQPNGAVVLASPDFSPGGGAWKGEYSTLTSYEPGDIVVVSTGGRSGYNDAQLLGTWICAIKNGFSTTNGVQFPVYPYPAPVYWRLLSFPPQQIYTCNAGTNNNNYANMSGTF